MRIMLVEPLSTKHKMVMAESLKCFAPRLEILVLSKPRCSRKRHKLGGHLDPKSEFISRFSPENNTKGPPNRESV